jgi:hypothetical protein
MGGGADRQPAARQLLSLPPADRLRREVVELVNDNTRARFHFDCAPVWRAQQESSARRAMGMKETSKC